MTRSRATRSLAAPRLSVPSLNRPPLRWLRRLLALACVLLALLSAARDARPESDASPTPSPAPGERVVPVTVAGADLRAYISPGDVVELLAASPADDVASTGTSNPDPRDSGASPTARSPDVAVLSEHATVLSLTRLDESMASTGAVWQLVVAVDEQAARKIADINGNPVVAVAGNSI